MKLFPGMTAYVTVPVAQATDVVKVPNGALRFTPDLPQQQISDALQKAGIGGGAGRTGKKGGQGAQQGSGQPASMAVVWKMNANKSLEPVLIKLGITDHTTTEVAQVMKGSLNPQDVVITGAASSKSTSASSAAPGMGGARGAGGGRVGR
jgi:HlyD family secretion protein